MQNSPFNELLQRLLALKRGAFDLITEQEQNRYILNVKNKIPQDHKDIIDGLNKVLKLIQKALDKINSKSSALEFIQVEKISGVDGYKGHLIDECEFYKRKLNVILEDAQVLQLINEKEPSNKASVKVPTVNHYPGFQLKNSKNYSALQDVYDALIYKKLIDGSTTFENFKMAHSFLSPVTKIIWNRKDECNYYLKQLAGEGKILKSGYREAARNCFRFENSPDYDFAKGRSHKKPPKSNLINTIIEHLPY